MNKVSLQQKLIELQRHAIEELIEKIEAAHSMIDIDENDTIDPEDLSHQTESAELKHLFDQQLIKAEGELESLKRIDFSKKDIAIPGAVVSTESFHFLLGYAAIPFEFEGKRIVGVSVDSPIYPEIRGKKVGDAFSYSNTSYTIKDIN
jgi:transcription elongation factor GreA